jgi:hypothetical protein
MIRSPLHAALTIHFAWCFKQIDVSCQSVSQLGRSVILSVILSVMLNSVILSFCHSVCHSVCLSSVYSMSRLFSTRTKQFEII